MNILFTICARAGSKGAKNKNVRIFCGRPLVYYTLMIYEKFREKHTDGNTQIDLAVNTDSELLCEQIKAEGISHIFVKRKETLAGDIVSKADVIRDTMVEAEMIQKVKYDLVVDLDLTSPLRNLEDVEGTIGQMLKNEKCNYAYSVTHARRNPYFNMVRRNEDGFFEKVIPSEYTARQQLPECFDMNASIYVFSREYLVDMRNENRRALVWKMEDSLVLDIDSDSDFEMMEMLTEYYWKCGRYSDIKGMM